MKLGIYVMRDQRTSFMTPTFDMNDQSAIRNFEHALSRADSVFGTHSEDFSLYRIGSYDMDTGLIASEAKPFLVVDGASFVVV